MDSEIDRSRRLVSSSKVRRDNRPDDIAHALERDRIDHPNVEPFDGTPDFSVRTLK